MGESIGIISSLDESWTAVEVDSRLWSREWEVEAVPVWQGLVMRSVESSSRRLRSVEECFMEILFPRMLRARQEMKPIVILLLRPWF